MATIQNDRDKLLQAAPVRFVLPPIDPARIPGLPGAFSNIGQLQQDVEDLGDQINHLMNTSGSFYIRASALAFFGAAGTTTPSTITLTAERGTGLVGGTIAWTVFAGSATISPSSGDSTVVTGSSVTGRSVTIRARLTIDSAVYDAYATITRFGAVSAVDQINLTSQVTGSLAAGNVSGLGALALLNTVNLNTQTTGALNGLTQVTNLGNLAYANAVAANQIGAGQLAAGVIYAGEINAEQITAGTITGRSLRTSATGERIEINAAGNRLSLFDHQGQEVVRIAASQDWSAFHTRSTQPGLICMSTGQGIALDVRGGSANFGLNITQSSTTPARAALKLQNNAALPMFKEEGSIVFWQGHMWFADGEKWNKVAVSETV